MLLKLKIWGLKTGTLGPTSIVSDSPGPTWPENEHFFFLSFFWWGTLNNRNLLSHFWNSYRHFYHLHILSSMFLNLAIFCLLIFFSASLSEFSSFRIISLAVSKQLVYLVIKYLTSKTTAFIPKTSVGFKIFLLFS